jgi:DNA-binding MarR family transcriptional regulator
MDQTSLTRTLAVLQKHGWIEKRIGDDRRSRVFAATRAGIAQVNRARPLWQRAQQRLLTAIGPDHLDPLGAVVEHVSVALHADTATAPMKRPVRGAGR